MEMSWEKGFKSHFVQCTEFIKSFSASCVKLLRVLKKKIEIEGK